ncbi:MAG TPA: peptide ABC transporter substrate-binding protein [Clostridia bacterium]|nr:peptide ABC transporter substrate-binding protein [Clostridia bacterium]
MSKFKVGKKPLAVLLFILLISFVFVGCDGKQEADFEKFIRHNHGQEPESIDPALRITVDGGTVVLACFEGLTTLDENDRPVPGVAERWDVTPDLTKYTFHLREDAKWSDGESVTAGDFYYAWQRALAPETQAEYAYQLFYIKNALEYNEGEMGAEDLGVTVINDYTLEVELNAPTPYFLNLTAYPTLCPVREDIITEHGDQWALSPETYIGNGPFMLEEWQSRDHMKFVRNENYWDKERVKIDGIIKTFIGEESTMMADYEAGRLDVIDSVPIEDKERLMGESGEFHSFPELSTYNYCFNVTKPPFDNVKVREAFALAVDRDDLVYKVRKSGFPATAFVPPHVPDVEEGVEFRTVGGDFFPTKAQPVRAQELIDEAGYPNGEGFPDVTLIYNSSEEHQIIAEAILEMWKQNLGITNINIQGQELGAYITNIQNGDFQMCRHCWVGDYTHAMSFLDLFTTGNGNNFTHWSNPDFDDLIGKARVAASEEERIGLLHDSEQMIMEDAILIPLFHYTEDSMIKPYVKNLHKSPLGFTYFDKVEIVR